jgi:hypothetical protein
MMLQGGASKRDERDGSKKRGFLQSHWGWASWVGAEAHMRLVIGFLVVTLHKWI